MESSREETKGSIQDLDLNSEFDQQELINIFEEVHKFPNDLKTEKGCLRYIISLQRRIIGELEERIRMKDVALEFTAKSLETLEKGS